MSDSSTLCAQVRERLAKALDAPLAPSARAEVERHLAQCDACRAVAGWMAQVDQVAARAQAGPPPSAEWLAGVQRRVMAEVLDAPSAATHQSPKARRTPWALAWTFVRDPRVVATVCAALVVGFFTYAEIRDRRLMSGQAHRNVELEDESLHAPEGNVVGDEAEAPAPAPAPSAPATAREDRAEALPATRRQGEPSTAALPNATLQRSAAARATAPTLSEKSGTPTQSKLEASAAAPAPAGAPTSSPAVPSPPPPALPSEAQRQVGAAFAPSNEPQDAAALSKETANLSEADQARAPAAVQPNSAVEFKASRPPAVALDAQVRRALADVLDAGAPEARTLAIAALMDQLPSLATSDGLTAEGKDAGVTQRAPAPQSTGGAAYNLSTAPPSSVAGASATDMRALSPALLDSVETVLRDAAPELPPSALRDRVDAWLRAQLQLRLMRR